MIVTTAGGWTTLPGPQLYALYRWGPRWAPGELEIMRVLAHDISGDPSHALLLRAYDGILVTVLDGSARIGTEKDWVDRLGHKEWERLGGPEAVYG